MEKLITVEDSIAPMSAFPILDVENEMKLALNSKEEDGDNTLTLNMKQLGLER